MTNLCFADDMDGLSGEEEELAKLTKPPQPTYGMEISAQKTKLMTNDASGIYTDIKINGQKLEIWAQL